MVYDYIIPGGIIKEVVLEYVLAINEHDVDKLYALMTEDYLFIDTYAAEVRGRENMREGWIGYFEWFPDYRIEVTDLLAEGETAVIIGYASGTYKGLATPDKRNFWRLPAAWKVCVKEGKVKLWQVICDSKIPSDLMSEADREKIPGVNPDLKKW